MTARVWRGKAKATTETEDEGMGVLCIAQGRRMLAAVSPPRNVQ